jgi:hypothetical protein
MESIFAYLWSREHVPVSYMAVHYAYLVLAGVYSPYVRALGHDAIRFITRLTWVKDIFTCFFVLRALAVLLQAVQYTN